MSTQQPLRTDFAARLRSAARTEGDRLRSTHFMRALLAGELEADAYAVMLAQDYFVYQALEEAADFMRADLVAGPFVSDRLHRTAALEADLHHYLGPDWKQVMSASEPTERKLIIAEVRLAYQLAVEVLGELGRRLAPRIPHPRRWGRRARFPARRAEEPAPDRWGAVRAAT